MSEAAELDAAQAAPDPIATPAEPDAVQAPAEPVTTPALSIRAKAEGFRRAGMAHSTHVRVHPAGTFTALQLAELEACPMLEVMRVAELVERPEGMRVPDEDDVNDNDLPEPAAPRRAPGARPKRR